MKQPGKKNLNTEADPEMTTEAQEEFEQAKKAALEAYNSFLEAKQHLKNAAENAGVEFRESANEQFHETVEKLTERRQELADQAGSYIRDNPLTSACMAFVCGMVASRLLK
ncbi:MAG TPA: hypothetical protein VNR18_02495 [Hyphomicrobiales bacterium]|nr:hypothetical protein [Hyphomicrobiales bacterium]